MKKRSGMAIIEFTLMSSFLMLLLMSVLSVGYLVFSMQAVSESVRVAARLAAVCQIGDDGVATYVATNSHAASLLAENIQIEYLDVNSNVIATPDSEDVWFVRARATGINYHMMSILSFLGENGVMDLSGFEMTIPSESLGLVPNGANTDC